MKIIWEEMEEEPETGFEQRAAELREQEKNSTWFLFPEDFEEDGE